MRKSVSFVAAGLGLALPILAGGFDSANARARISLNQCIAGYNSCIDRCIASGVDNPMLPGAPGNAQWGYCSSSCDSNHSACVDMAMSNKASAPPPKRPIMPAGSILDTSPGFSLQPPSSTGTPIAPPKTVIR